MPQAKVVLESALSYSRGGRRFERGIPQIVDDEHEIAFYRATGGFAVELLPEPGQQRGQRGQRGLPQGQQYASPAPRTPLGPRSGQRRQDPFVGSIAVPEAIKPGRDVQTVGAEHYPDEDELEEAIQDDYAHDEDVGRDVGHDPDKFGTGGHLETTARASSTLANERLPNVAGRGQVAAPGQAAMRAGQGAGKRPAHQPPASPDEGDEGESEEGAEGGKASKDTGKKR